MVRLPVYSDLSFDRLPENLAKNLTLPRRLTLPVPSYLAQAEGQTGFTVNDREGEMMEPTDAEDDLLDMAFGLEATSRCPPPPLPPLSLGADASAGATGKLTLVVFAFCVRVSHLRFKTRPLAF